MPASRRRPQDIATISIRLTGARYKPLDVRVADSRRRWWLRSRSEPTLGIPASGWGGRSPCR